MNTDLGTAETLCGDRNLCARPYGHTGEHESFAHDRWISPDELYARQREALRRERERMLGKLTKPALARMHKENGGLMPLSDYLRWSKDELIRAVMDDEEHVHRPASQS